MDIRDDLDHAREACPTPTPTTSRHWPTRSRTTRTAPRNASPTPSAPGSQLQNDGGNDGSRPQQQLRRLLRSFLDTCVRATPQVSGPPHASTPDAARQPRPLVRGEEGGRRPHRDHAGRARTTPTAAPATGATPPTAWRSALQQQRAPARQAVDPGRPRTPAGAARAWNAVNHNGKIVWIDTQSGEVSEKPLHIDQAKHVWHIPLDADRNPIDTSQSDDKDSKDAEDSDNQKDGSQNQNDETVPAGELRERRATGEQPSTADPNTSAGWHAPMAVSRPGDTRYRDQQYPRTARQRAPTPLGAPAVAHRHRIRQRHAGQEHA